MLALLSKMFRLAMKWHASERFWRSDSPTIGVQKFPEQKRERWLNEDEMTKLLGALDSYSESNIANVVRLILLTGSRKSEVLRAEWSEFDLAAGIWTKPYTNTKQKRTEHVQLSRPAIQILQEMKPKATGPFLFPSSRLEDNPLEDIKQHWKLITESAKLPGVCIHDLRHTFASHLVSKGVPLEFVGQMLGHTHKATTQRYAHLAQKPLKDAANTFGKDLFCGEKEKTVKTAAGATARG